MTMTLERQIEILQQYSACDISDALVKLQPIPNTGGFLCDIDPYAPHAPHSPELTLQPKLIAPAYTLDFSSPHHDAMIQSDIPQHSHFADETRPGSIVIARRPPGMTSACIGGIVAARMQARGALAIVVSGRVRDVQELRALSQETPGGPFHVWASGTSTVGAAAEPTIVRAQVPIVIGGTKVKPDDIVFADPANGVVVIPRELVVEVVKVLPKLVEADERVKQDVKAGGRLKEAFSKHRGKL
ncbi:MAG: hypothetical protein M1825_006241 [Sarcosagium campestre]|nr:MAG: hypothetical protein M1825_006241 [Sarcosagium campestre]